MDFQGQLEHTRRYADAFWQHGMLDRPYVSVQAPIRPFASSYSQARSFLACMTEEYDSVINPFLEAIESTYYGGEALPMLEITLGPDQYAAFLGAELEAREATGTTWAHPCVKDWSEYTAKIDKSKDGYFNKLKRYYEYAAKKGKDRFLLSMLDMHSNMDALSALRGPQDLCMDLYDCPEEVMRVLSEVRGTFREILDMPYEAGRMKDIGTMGWHPIYCQGKAAVSSCDFSCMIGAEHGRKYVFPAIEEETGLMDHCIYHLDGKEALVHLDTILAIDGIDCVQWVPGDGQPRTFAWMDVLKKIQAAGRAVWIYDWTAEEIKAYHKELEPDKVAYSLGVDSPDTAEELLEYLVKNT